VRRRNQQPEVAEEAAENITAGSIQEESDDDDYLVPVDLEKLSVGQYVAVDKDE